MTYIHNWNSFNENINLLNNLNDFDYILEGNNTLEFMKEKIKNMFDKLKTKSQIKEFFKQVVTKIFKSKLPYKRILLIFLISISTSKIASSDLKRIDFIENEIKDYVNKLIDFGLTPYKDISYMDASSDETLEFLDKLAYRESRNNWLSAKKGYVGKYQFGKHAFKDIKKNQIDSATFVNNPNLYPEDEQNRDVIKLLKNNKYYLRNYYKYIGQTIGGIKITESGMLAASHLVGQKAVKNFLSSNGKINDKDGNGVSCYNYLKYFTGYKLNLI
jgi:hypothetical protein